MQVHVHGNWKHHKNTAYFLDQGSTAISKVASEKDVGITFDKHLKCSEYNNKSVNNAN